MATSRDLEEPGGGVDIGRASTGQSVVSNIRSGYRMHGVAARGTWTEYSSPSRSTTTSTGADEGRTEEPASSFDAEDG